MLPVLACDYFRRSRLAAKLIGCRSFASSSPCCSYRRTSYPKELGGCMRTS